jgi:hypothetical protein
VLGLNVSRDALEKKAFPTWVEILDKVSIGSIESKLFCRL